MTPADIQQITLIGALTIAVGAIWRQYLLLQKDYIDSLKRRNAQSEVRFFLIEDKLGLPHPIFEQFENDGFATLPSK